MIALEHLTTPHSMEVFNFILAKHLETWSHDEVGEITDVLCMLHKKSSDGAVSLNIRNIERFRYALVHMERLGYTYVKKFDDIVGWLTRCLIGRTSQQGETCPTVYAEKTEDGWCLVIGVRS